MTAGFPVGSAQKKVLEALGLKATNFADAEQIFGEHGIIVASKRGTPEIRTAASMVGGWNVGGDGDSEVAEYKKIDLAKIAQWIVK